MGHFWILLFTTCWSAFGTAHLPAELERGDSPTIIQGRLTLTAGNAVTTADVTAATTVYFTPYQGSNIAVYSGSNWQLLSFSEISVAVPATTSTPFDIFAYNNSGNLALEATSWSNDTTRATDLALQNGVYVKTGSATRRYLGTARTTSVSGQTEDSVTKRFLWNYYNQASKILAVSDATNSWSYVSNSYRASNNNTANRVEIVLGVLGQSLSLDFMQYGTTAGANYVGICEDCTNSYTATYGRYGYGGSGQIHAFLRRTPAIGYHYYQMIEFGGASSIWYGAFNHLLRGSWDC